MIKPAEEELLLPPFCKRANQGQELCQRSNKVSFAPAPTVGMSKSSPNVLPFLPEPRGHLCVLSSCRRKAWVGLCPGAPSPPRHAHRLPWASSPGDRAPCPAFSPLRDHDTRPCLGHSPREQLGLSYRVASSRQRPPATQPLCPGLTGLGLGSWGLGGSASGVGGWVPPQPFSNPWLSLPGPGVWLPHSLGGLCPPACSGLAVEGLQESRI